MKKRFVSILKKKERIPLSLFYLEKEAVKQKHEGILKTEAVEKLNSKGYILCSFYKPISKL